MSNATGELYPITTRLDKIISDVTYTCGRLCGILLSIASISREKRFKILPIGVVSKNDMGALIRLENIFMWKTRDACTIPLAMRSEYIKVLSAESKESINISLQPSLQFGC